MFGKILAEIFLLGNSFLLVNLLYLSPKLYSFLAGKKQNENRQIIDRKKIVFAPKSVNIFRKSAEVDYFLHETRQVLYKIDK